MNFITFSAATTNIFPANNTTTGGQLVTEWNLKSRESVATDSNITYDIGPSFVHSATDFEVSLLADSGGAVINSYTLAVAPGRGVINGHFVQTLVPMTIDLVEANTKLSAQSMPLLKGNLAIGIRTFFATEQTVAGSILVENKEEMFLGVQLVVLPEEEMITPSESPDDSSKVTADIRLATFTYLNNIISGIRNSTAKLQYISADRVANLQGIVSSKYVTKTGLNYKKIYAFAGKGSDPSTGYDTWEDVTDSLMIWDAEPTRTLEKPSYKQAEFVPTASGVYFVLPHKQITGMTDDDGNEQFYAPRIMEVPMADYTSGKPGLVNNTYTRQIKRLAEEVSNFKTTLTGKQIYYMDTRTVTTTLPNINDAWEVGDYILVRNDEFYLGGSDATMSAPSTMYVVLPGRVYEVRFIAQLNGDATTEPGLPDHVDGAELGFQEWYQAQGQEKPNTEYPEYYPTFFNADDIVRGVPVDSSTDTWYDYFRIRYYLDEGDNFPFIDYFYGVYTTGPREWSDAVMVTGSVALATESTIGGFYNASEDATDYGYVYLDDTGHLRLLDYQLLRSGTLAYQIGDDITLPSGIDVADTQNYINEYVNQRIAFPTVNYLSSVTSLIHIYIPLSASEEAATIEINGIDSRFNTAVCLHIQGDAGSNVTINISDCQKLMIDPTIEGNPTINIFRTCLKYDPVVFEYIRTCTRDTATYGSYTGFRDLSIWYERLTDEDPILTCNGMTISELDSQIITTSIDYWKEKGAAVNDNNYLVALKSITFSSDGDIVGCQVLTANNSTDNIVAGDKIIVGDIVLPQGSSLIYPIACLTKILKVTGTFTSAYYSDESWYVTDNNFTLVTGTYSPVSTEKSMTGQIAFHSKTTIIPSTISQTSISAWEPDSYHLFSGGSII